MSAWTEGYVTELGYTYGYFGELNPLRIRLALLNKGVAVPEVINACELGFGQGMSINLHAAGSDINWYGCDFNPAQAGFAENLALVSGNSASLSDESFKEFCSRNDLPKFEFIALHGIWSWISDENRALIVQFIERKLRPGGVVYISYNSLPGWSTFKPLRQIFSQVYSNESGFDQTPEDRIENAIGFTQKLLATNPSYLQQNPHLKKMMDDLSSKDKAYLAHEYFNADWHPKHFYEVYDDLSSAKLEYVCSAHYLDHIDSVNLTDDQRGLLKEIKSTRLRETARDAIINQLFRKDYWIKGRRTLSPSEQKEAINNLNIVLIKNRGEIELTVHGALGEGMLNIDIYEPILDVLAGHEIFSVKELGEKLEEDISFAQLVEALMTLANDGRISLVDSVETNTANIEQCRNLNNYLIKKSEYSDSITYLASPVTGGGIFVSRFEQLFLLARANGEESSKNWASYVWRILSSQGQKLIKSGKTIESEAENIAELQTAAESFERTRLPLLEKLKII